MGFCNQFRVCLTNLGVVLRQTVFFFGNRPGPGEFSAQLGPARSQMAEISNTGHYFEKKIVFLNIEGKVLFDGPLLKLVGRLTGIFITQIFNTLVFLTHVF